MANIYIVGRENSFTHEACLARYGGTHSYKFGCKHPELVKLLIENSVDEKDAAVVPLWNSNAGTINMSDEKNQDNVVKLLTKEAGVIVDIWPHHILFNQGVKAGLAFDTNKGNIFSVEVAEKQCSKYLKLNNISSKNQRFIPGETTNIAMDKFISSGVDGDAVLCGEKLLLNNQLDNTNEKVTNQNNLTVFLTANTHPLATAPKNSLAAVTFNITGENLPIEFTRYWREDLLPMIDIPKFNSLLSTMPKIIFVLRYESSKVLVLMEMPIGTGRADELWPSPFIDDGEVNKIALYENVGISEKSFPSEMIDILMNKCSMKEDGVVFYGSENSFFWISPILNISVQGYDSNLVKKCAELQVKHLFKVMTGFPNMFEPKVKVLLEQYEADHAYLKLTDESLPTIP